MTREEIRIVIDAIINGTKTTRKEKAIVFHLEKGDVTVDFSENLELLIPIIKEEIKLYLEQNKNIRWKLFKWYVVTKLKQVFHL